MKSLSQDMKIEIFYLSSGKWDKLDKSGMVFPQPRVYIGFAIGHDRNIQAFLEFEILRL